MTREEALEQAFFLSKTTHSICLDSESFWDNVIEALSLEPCDDAISRQAMLDVVNFEDKWLFDAKSYNENTKIAFSSMKSKISEMPSVTPQPCEDAISRQMAIDELKDIKDLQGRNLFAEKGLFPWNVIAQLPSVTPQQRTSKWIAVEDEEGNIIGYYCSKCDLPMETEEKTKYCPHCGAKMEVE